MMYFPVLQTNHSVHLRRLLNALLLAAALLVLAFAGAQPVAAQDNSGEPTATAVEEATSSSTEGGAAGTNAVAAPDAEGVTANAVNDVARQLWCPLCSGVRLDACELKACSQMKDVIGQKLAGGENVDSIKSYFVAQYGPQVLGEPPLEGFNWLAWILPVLALVAGGLFVWSRLRSGAQQAQRTTAGAPAAAAGDPYSRKLEEELKHYD